MISDNLYPTSQNYGNLACTAAIPDLTPISDSVGDSYYLGYVTYENYPQFLNMSYPTNTDTECGFTTDEPQNHSWGYVTHAGVESFANLYYNDNGDIKAGYTGLLHRFINDGYMCNFNTANRIALNWEWMAVPTSSIGENGTAWGVKDYSRNLFARFGFDSIHTVDGLQSAIENDETLFTVTIRFAAADHQISAKYSDFDTRYHMCRIVDGDYTIFVRCYGYYMARNSVYADYYNGQVSFVPFFGYHYESDNIQAQDIVIAGGRNISTSTYMVGFNFNTGLMFKPFPADNPNFPDSYNINIEGNAPGNFYKYPNISRADLPSQQNYGGILYGAYMIQFERSYYGNFLYSIHDCLDIKDVWKLSYFYFKRQKDLTADTTPPRSTTYTTENLVSTFNDTQNPLWEYVNGSYTQIVSDLQLWQYPNVSVTASTYEPKDLPPYDGGGGDEDEESGTRIPNQFRYFTGANNFISQYAMKATQIQTFGQMLWNSWADGNTFVDAVNNFWIALNIEEFTGSFDISSVMDFIVGLKVFPFNITHFETSAFTYTDTLRIGRGTFPFLFPSEVGDIIKVLSTVIFIDCGKVHDGNGHYGIPRVFNDFRDYTNITISCFCPYCGTVELNAGDVIGRQLSCKYAVDLQTGDCLCFITVEDSGDELYNVATISGNMGANIPVSATNSGLIMSRRISDITSGVGLFGGMFTENVSAGASQFANPYRQQSAIGAIAKASYNALGNVFKDVQQAGQFATNMLSRGAIGCPVMQSGEGFTSFSQADTPYIQMRYGIYSEPANYSHSVGRISTSSGTIGSYKGSGFITCENVDTTKLTCHNDEKAAIATALETGVFV